MLRLPILLVLVGCASAQHPDTCRPYSERCRDGAIEVCRGGYWEEEMLCSDHGARCSEEPDGEAICYIMTGDRTRGRRRPR